MYTIYANDNLIYSPDLVTDYLFVTGPTYSKEVNKAGSCQFYVYPDNPYYDKIETLKTKIVVKENDEVVWRGRVQKSEMDFDRRKTIYCEGVLSYFVDSTIRPFKHTKTMPEQFNYLIDTHNEEIEDHKKFTVGSITVDDLYGSKEWDVTDYSDTLTLIKKIVDEYGGYLVVGYDENTNRNTISYLKNPTKDSNQVIEFGENLLKINSIINPNNVFTVLIPVGYDSEGNPLDIKPYNDGKDYIVSDEGIEKFGKIIRHNTFDKDFSNAEDLLTEARKFLNDNIKESKTLEIKAVDLHMIHSGINRIDVYDMIKVHSEPHNLDEYEMCTKITINMENPENSEYIIGTVPKGIEDDIAEQAKKEEK